jgi:hypothetical protein
MKNIIISQFVILLIGTLFAWGNFGYELYGWLKIGSCQTGCSIGAANPFLTPCFYGALFFTLVFILSAVSLKRISKI